MPILEVKGLTKKFGGLTAVDDLSFDVMEGQIMGLIGPNGAGKTTTYSLISGFLRLTKGKIIYKGKDITHLKPYQLAAKGLVRTFQATNLFKDMTVFDNIAVAQEIHLKGGFWGAFFGSNAPRSSTGKDVNQRTLDILEYMKLAPFKDELAKNLPHGYQRTLGIAAGLAVEPNLLMLDEPFTGMNQQELSEIIELLRGLTNRGITLMIVEHNMKAIMGLSDFMVVINFGKKIAEGPPKEIQNNKEVIRAYLGAEELIV